MSFRSYSKILLHLIWGTKNREKSLADKSFRKTVSEYLYNYSNDKSIPMIMNYVNSDHVHALIELPTNKTIEEVMQLLKGSSSHWINEQVSFKFAWGKGYGVFSVSESKLNTVKKYIKNQEEHHRDKGFSDEYETFISVYKSYTNR